MLAAACLLPATIAHTRRLHRPSYHCHTVAQFQLETEHSSKPSRSRVSQRLRAHQDEMIYGLRTYASLVADTVQLLPLGMKVIIKSISNTTPSLLRSRRRSRLRSRALAACGFFVANNNHVCRANKLGRAASIPSGSRTATLSRLLSVRWTLAMHLLGRSLSFRHVCGWPAARTPADTISQFNAAMHPRRRTLQQRPELTGKHPLLLCCNSNTGASLETCRPAVA